MDPLIRGPMERRIRKVTVYVCTECYLAYPGKGEAKGHWDAAHHKPVEKRPRGRPRKGA